MRLSPLLFALVILLSGMGSYAASTHHSPVDRDLDGVFDNRDCCPHTPFWALVNRNGCMIQKIHLPEKKVRERQKHLSTQRR